MYPQSTVMIARLLSDLGVLDRENAEICGVSIRSIRHWRCGDRRGTAGRRRGNTPKCPRCDRRPLDEAAYSYLLGLYLGDGHIAHARKSYRLDVACADCWPGLLEEARRTMIAVMPSSSVFLRSRPGVACTYVASISKHWPCLFPQHGPGKKHEREIKLESWQQAIVGAHTGLFVRGLFHSDGCRTLNRVRRKYADGDRWYEYPRYFFTNYSTDILRLCGESLDALGIAWRIPKSTVISVAQRGAVERLDEFVGAKF